MTEKFTPGPWRRDPFGGIVDATNRRVWIQGASLPMRRDDEAEANADLVAAAPELLGALEELYAMVKGECPSILAEDSGGSAHTDLRIQEAIKKARGEK